MKPSRLLPLLLAFIKFISSMLVASSAYELHRDEYLYLNYGQHLAWGYLEVPPLMALQSWLTLALGGSWFWVKFWPVLWGSLTVYVVARAAQRLGGGSWAVVLAGICYLVGAYTRLNFLFQPNSFEVFAFTAVGYLLIRYQQDGRPRWWLAMGILLGLALLNKYSALFFIAALGVALLLTPLRWALRTRAFWLGAGLALLLWLPNLLWQLRHGIPFRHHMALLHDTQLVNVSVADFWKDQLLMNLPGLWVWSAGLLALLAGPLRQYRAVGLLSCGGWLLLTVLHGKSYYALGYYPILFAAGGVWWEQAWAKWPRAARLARPVLLLLPVLLCLPLLPLLFTVEPPARMQALGPRYQSTGAFRWEDGRNHALPQDFADMLGWQELADKTWQAYLALPAATRAHTLILAANYGQAGAINYYNRRRPLPAAHSFNGSYLLWQSRMPSLPWQYVLLIDDEPDNLAAHFRSFCRVGEVRNPYARERGTAILLGTGPDSAIVQRIRQERRQGLAEWGKFREQDR
ncbi:glycosyltransferase family 39 protein [Hymenobacter rigui]|uniref:Phospholipid carrier-dependent glycosyltransferase n=1 Tax=Hymenobacter rigui TaxID=334424 RepID=A0A428KQP3_9BACT|nr:glycosyltransferase family 39 protein [Hymenobacter rigui]RSK48756.1 phospholipid carrier-dependent glycosyltransferase [Hymenobacter rigui]